MRIKKEYKERGEFWFPAKPSEKFQGTLCIENGGSATLQLESPAYLILPKKPILHIENRILGKLNKGGDVLLVKCRNIERGRKIIFRGCIFFEYKYSLKRVFVGDKFNSEDADIKINSFTFYVDGFHHWFTDTEHSLDTRDFDNFQHLCYEIGAPVKSRGKELTFIYKKIDDFVYKLSNDMNLIFSINPLSSDHDPRADTKEKKNHSPII